ncbi:phage related protein [Firmicutes bacterium CAG:646]|nr:phage related protein [Firmicutes bacterium CAG:646]
MNREILFKAKRKDSGEWVYGYYRCIPCMGLHGHYIMPQNPKNRLEQYEIDPDTICQYTGLTDKNGKRIWENDICIIKDGTLDEEDGYFICEWDDCIARYILDGDGLTADFDSIDERNVEVIGNIFDNADLLEVE